MEVYFAIALYLLTGCGFGLIPMAQALFTYKFPWWFVVLFWPVFGVIYLKKLCDFKTKEND